jgi:hypothetical protein
MKASMACLVNVADALDYDSVQVMLEANFAPLIDTLRSVDLWCFAVS